MYFLWDSNKNSVTPIYYPIINGVITREHIETKVNYDERMESFISRLNNSMEFTLSFTKNMENFLRENKVNKNVKQIIMESING